MDNLEYIEAYFDEKLPLEEKTEFEQRITKDPVFAEEVAFYLSSIQAAHTELHEEKERFKELYSRYRPSDQVGDQRPALLRQLWPWVAAAAILAGVIFGWNALFKPVDSKELAEKYITEHFQTLSVTMGNKEDSLQAGLRFYNNGKVEEAMRQFESIAQNDTSSIEAKKYAGIVSLRLGQYDKAINYFSQIENAQLYANPGKFYRAVTLMKRNRPGDTESARQLLRQVVENNLEGKEDAEKWLRKW